MDLDVYLNELSIVSQADSNDMFATSREHAHVLMKNFVKIYNLLLDVGFDKMRYSKSIKGIFLQVDYSINSWMIDDEVEQDIKDLFIVLIGTFASPFIDKNDTFIIPKNKCYYDEQPALGLGIACAKQMPCVSFATHECWGSEIIKLTTNSTAETLKRHISSVQHFENQKRIFKLNPKHGKGGKGHHRNQSTIYCASNEEAQRLLNTAVPHPNKTDCFCEYDANHKRFIIFPMTGTGQRTYHGYHLEDVDTDLNDGKKGIPIWLQKMLKERST
jgi:hypothetical protein